MKIGKKKEVRSHYIASEIVVAAKRRAGSIRTRRFACVRGFIDQLELSFRCASFPIFISSLLFVQTLPICRLYSLSQSHPTSLYLSFPSNGSFRFCEQCDDQLQQRSDPTVQPPSSNSISVASKPQQHEIISIYYFSWR